MDRLIVGHSMVLRFLRNEDHILFYETLIEEQAKNIVSIILLRTPFDALKKLLEKERAANKREKRAAKTKLVREAAMRRSRSIMHIKLLTEAMLYGTDENARRAASTLITQVYDRRRQVLKTKMQEQTRMCDELIRDMSGQEYADMLARLNLDGPLKEFISANENFKALYENVKMASSPDDVANFRAVRCDLDVAFTKLADTIEMLYKINDMGSREAVLQSRLAGIINFINGHIINAATDLAERGLKYGKVPVRPQPLPTGESSATQQPQQ